MNHREARALHKLLSGGLHTDDESTGIGLQDAALRVAAAQLRAIRFALATDEHTEQPKNEGGRQGWEFGDTFGKADAIIALGGVMCLLDNIHHVSRDVMKALDRAEEEARQ